MNYVDIIHGDALSALNTLDDETINTCVTSPPYWGLRDYGVPGQLGLEASLDEFLEKMVILFREVRRVLRKDGTCWINIGDTYLRQQGRGFNGNKRLPEIDRSIRLKSPVRNKNLLGVPWKLAFALQNDGWNLRSEIIWNKPNAMPESCKDRPSRDHEYIFLLTKSAKYYYDIDSTRTPHKKDGRWSTKRTVDTKYGKPEGVRSRTFHTQTNIENCCHPKGKNLRTVWRVSSRGFKGAHFATFPEKLIEPCILAGCPPEGWVLDPFLGSGTTACVAVKRNRNCFGIELNEKYIDIARERIRDEGGLTTVIREWKPDQSLLTNSKCRSDCRFQL